MRSIGTWVRVVVKMRAMAEAHRCMGGLEYADESAYDDLEPGLASPDGHGLHPPSRRIGEREADGVDPLEQCPGSRIRTPLRMGIADFALPGLG